ncbi:MAG: efflux RND transporter periplasmic adaptor subunit [Candidatus Cybelea sp.]
MDRYRRAALLCAVCALPIGCGHSENGNAANVAAPPAVVRVTTLRRATVPITADYQGTLGSIESVQIRARVEGTLDRVLFKEGRLVHKGDLIFELQHDAYAAALQSAQAQFDTARAQVVEAYGNLFAKVASLARDEITVARDRPLAADKAIPQKDLDNAVATAEMAKGDVIVARAQVGQARAGVLNAQAGVMNAKLNLSYTTIYAPVTGLIGFLNYDVGNVVGGPSTQVLDTIDAIDPIKITFALDEPAYLDLFGQRKNPNVSSLRYQPLQLILANDATYQYTGRLYTINSTVDSRTGTLTVESRFPNPEGLLRPGGFARVRLMIERRPDALVVPETAIVKSQGLDAVYVVNSNGTASLRTISLGPQYGSGFVVDSGLQAGDRVVVQGTQKVVPGAKVTIKTN